jgi:hypothetical protein
VLGQIIFGNGISGAGSGNEQYRGSYASQKLGQQSRSHFAPLQLLDLPILGRFWVLLLD